ncbi:MAG TPA: efflux RND transporter periplasmic adaptor subunit [Gemmataceae bacterium]|nr:efflux RND transporter periplasmic adaptor subunit [Gemmataceae bacterium]
MRPCPRLAGLLAALAAAAGCGKPHPDLQPTPPAEVTVCKPIVRKVTDYDEFPGKVAARQTVEVRARVSGYLTKILFQDGDEVAENKQLFEIDPRPYQADYDNGRAKVELAQARSRLADTEVKRNQPLVNKGAITPEDFDKLVAQQQEARAAVSAARAALEGLKLNLDWTKVNAPIAGKVSRRYVDVGNLVSGTVGSATLLTTLVTVDPMYVYFNPDERALQRYKARAEKNGDKPVANVADARIPVRVGLATDTGFPYEGVIDFADNRVDPRTGTIQVRAVVKNPERRLVDGYFARVQVPVSDPYPAVLVAERAIGTEQGERYVLVVSADNVVDRRAVKLGKLVGGLRVITEGVGPDDWVIVEGLQHTRAGETVVPHREPMPVPGAR